MGGGTGEPSSESPAKNHTGRRKWSKDLPRSPSSSQFHTAGSFAATHTHSAVPHCHIGLSRNRCTGTDGSREHCRQNTHHARMCPCIFNVRTSHCMAQDEVRMCVCVCHHFAPSKKQNTPSLCPAMSSHCLPHDSSTSMHTSITSSWASPRSSSSSTGPPYNNPGGRSHEMRSVAPLPPKTLSTGYDPNLARHP